MRGSVLVPPGEADATVRMPAVPGDPAAPRVARSQPPVHRADIQGLRAVAVGLVVLYHAGLPGLTGGFVGVDVFFVISGFLITQGLVRELESRGTVSLTGFYARRARRILPAATVTLVAVAAATVVLLPETRWLQVGRDILSSALYVVNWDLADRSVQYSARGQASSPLQHFWSLAVEEQFYLLWPLTILLVVVLVRAARRWWPGAGRAGQGMSRRHLWLPLALIALPSLAWSVHLTTVDPGPAYFVTTTRMWELALGAALAVVPATVLVRGRSALVVGWAGLALIGYAALTFDEATAFPGSAALLPTVGAVAVLFAGLSGERRAQNPLLCSRPMGWVGGLSYSLYLWHWPVLVIATAMAGGQLLTRYALVLVVLAVVPAWLSLRLVEKPALSAPKLRSDDGRTLQLGALCMLIALVGGFLLQQGVLGKSDPAAAAGAASDGGVAGGSAGAASGLDSSANPGAVALLWDPANGKPVDSFPSVIPTPLSAAVDWLSTTRPGCTPDFSRGNSIDCALANLEGSTRIALVGDSHAEHLAAGVQEAAVANGWRLDISTMSGCPFAAVTVDINGVPATNCDERNAEVTEKLLADPPDVVVVGTSRYAVHGDDGVVSLEDSRPLMVRGFREAWAPLIRAGVEVVSVRDTPRPGVPVPDCVAMHPDRLTECAMDRDQMLDEGGPEVVAAEGLDGAHVLDLTPWICPTDRCPAVIGGTIVYRDTDHLTATYARSLGGAFDERLRSVIG